MQWLLVLIPFVVFADVADDLRRIRNHLYIEDAASALYEAEAVVAKHPESIEAAKVLVEALAASGFEERAIEAWNELSHRQPDLIYDRHLLEELCWGVLKKGIQSTQYGIRLSALVGSFLTHDTRAVPILIRMMRDSNAVVRSVAIQMAAQMRDAPLKDEIRRLMHEEKIWVVRLAVIQTVGALRMSELTSELQVIVQSEKSTYEERGLAIEALLQIYENISLEQLTHLAKSNRAGMRHLACSIAAHFEMNEAKDLVLGLVCDAHPQVRIAALNALGLFYRHQIDKEKGIQLLSAPLADRDPHVAITAAWTALLIDPHLGVSHFEKWLKDEFGENRRLAAAALAVSGPLGADLSARMIHETTDPYVAANLAIGLLGQKTKIKDCCDLIFQLLESEKRMWMWDAEANPLFSVLAPSKVRYVDHIPNYPEAVDQMTRLNLVSLLALSDDPRSTEAFLSFLQKRSWGITGVAAAMLLQEGDDLSLEAVRGLLKNDDPDIRLQACLVLAMMGRDETVLADLQGAYAASGHERKLHILEALARIGSPASHSFLIGLLKEPFPILRVGAAAALIQCLNR